MKLVKTSTWPIMTAEMRMETKINLYFIIAVVFLSSTSIMAQSPDYGMWIGIDGEKDITNKLEGSINLQGRTYEDCSSLSQWLAETGVTWKTCKYVDLSLMYRFIVDYEDDDGIEYKHRWYADAKGKVDIYRFKLSTRFRYLQQFNASQSFEKKEVLRNKWELAYNIDKCSLSPFVSIEWFAPLDDDKVDIEDWRYMAGVTWKINKKQALDIAWLGEQEADESINIHVLSLTWKQKF